MVRLSDDQKILSEPEVGSTLIKRFAGDPKLGAEIGKILGSTSNPQLQNLILGAIAASDATPLHPSWSAPLNHLLANSTGRDHEAVIAAIAAIDTDQFNGPLEKIGADPSVDALVRVSALAAVQKTSGALSDATFDRLRAFAGDATQPVAALRATQLIAASNLNSERLQSLAQLTESASPLQLREWVRCFARARDSTTIESFLESLGHATSLLSLAPNELSDAVKKYPPEMLPRANELLGKTEAT